MTLKLIGSLVTVTLFLSACGSLPTTNTQTEMEPKLLIVSPRQSSPELEVELAKLSELIHLPDISPEQRASFLYDRAVRYDLLGLRTLARIDFSRVLQVDPTYSDAYNFIGIYMTQVQEFDRAYESFDAVLELDPDNYFAYYNRGVALYYGGRTQLAINDLTYFHTLDPSDPYRTLWLYFAHYRADAAQAMTVLNQYQPKLNSDHWNEHLIRYFRDEISGNDLIIAAQQNVQTESELAKRLCEVYFYLGKKSKFDGEYRQALNYFKLALATNIYDYVEHRYAKIEMSEIIVEQRNTKSI